MDKISTLLCAAVMLNGVYLTSNLLAVSSSDTNSQVQEHNDKTNNPTAGDQSETKEDREITQKIRRLIMEDDSLSIGAKNVVIVTISENVTLRGVVENAEEKKSIESKAKSVDAVKKVDNQIEIKATKKK